MSPPEGPAIVNGDLAVAGLSDQIGGADATGAGPLITQRDAPCR